MSVLYTEVAPSPALASVVACYWSVQGVTPSEVANRVLPDGCMDVIFNLGDATLPAGVAHHGLTTYVVGAMRTAVVVRHTGEVDLIGVRFRPGGAVRVLEAAASELTGGVAELSCFWPEARLLAEALYGAGGPSANATGDGGSAAAAGRAARGRLRARADLLERALLQKGGGMLARDPLVAAATTRIAETRGTLAVASLHRALGTSERTLGRRFVAQVGVTPKEACRIERLGEAARLLRLRPGPSLARAAAMAGFADQAHLTHEFARLAGITPAAWLREQGDGFVQDAGTDMP